MTRLPITQIDAFADRPFTGNPAAVMPLEAWLDDDVLQAIATENNLSETAFLIPATGDADYELRWFTPAAEVALCGHATLASGHFILGAEATMDQVRFRTRQAGVLEVSRAETGYELALPAWGPSPKPLPDIVAALGLTGAVEALWQDKGYALIVAEAADTVRNLTPDSRALAACGAIVTIVTAPGDATGSAAAGGGTDVISRVFTPTFGMDEDPVTGSAHAVMVPYWAARFGRNSFTAYQASARGGHLTCRLEGDRVILGGRCVTVLEGNFLLAE